MPSPQNTSQKQPSKKRGMSQRSIIATCVGLMILFGAGGFGLKLLTDRTASPVQLQEAKRKVPIKKIDWEKTLLETPQFQGFRENGDPALEIEQNTEGNPTPFERKKGGTK